MLFLVVIFGLFHGLVLLPVLLSLVGPKAYGAVMIEKTGPEGSAGGDPPSSTESDPKVEMKERVNSFDNEASTPDA